MNRIRNFSCVELECRLGGVLRVLRMKAVYSCCYWILSFVDTYCCNL